MLAISGTKNLYTAPCLLTSPSHTAHWQMIILRPIFTDNIANVKLIVHIIKLNEKALNKLFLLRSSSPMPKVHRLL